jgi:hypothetical protein
MFVKVTFACPVCENPARLILDRARDWQCGKCDQRLSIPVPDPKLPACVVCGNHELYKKKAFPHWLGMSILIAACVASVFTYGWYEKWATWGILIGSAMFDGLLYLLVGDVIVCYRCQAHYSGIEPTDRHKPHELIVGERYRQEKIRTEQINRGAGIQH